MNLLALVLARWLWVQPVQGYTIKLLWPDSKSKAFTHLSRRVWISILLIGLESYAWVNFLPIYISRWVWASVLPIES